MDEHGNETRNRNEVRQEVVRNLCYISTVIAIDHFTPLLSSVSSSPTVGWKSPKSSDFCPTTNSVVKIASPIAFTGRGQFFCMLGDAMNALHH